MIMGMGRLILIYIHMIMDKGMTMGIVMAMKVTLTALTRCLTT